MNRRKFTKTIGLGAIGVQMYAVSVSENLSGFNLNKPNRIPLGLCNHSLRSSNLNVEQLIEYAINSNLDSVLINNLPTFQSLEKTPLLKLKKIAQNNKVTLYIGAGCISEKSTAYKNKYGSAKAQLLEGIRVASLLGSPIVGCRIGSTKERFLEGGIRPHMKAVVEVMQSVKQEALDAGIKFAIENHAGDLRAEEVLEIVEATGTDICGILFDPANAVWVLEDPMETLEKFKKHIVCTSVRDIIVWKTEDGAVYQCTAIGEGMLDFKKYTEILAKNCPGVPIHVESISNAPIKLPYRTDEFMKGFPDLDNAEIIKFGKLAKKGTVQEILIPKKGESKKEFQIQLQEKELQKSFTYLRNYCNTGMKVEVD